MERRGAQQNFVEMFGGMVPSKQAVNLAIRVISLGEDPTAYTQRAGKAALEDGRNKVGFFGKAARPLNDLKAVATSIENGNAITESRRRFANRKF